jgi:hypothetical protein
MTSTHIHSYLHNFEIAYDVNLNFVKMMMLFESVGKHIESTMMMMFNVMLLLVVVVVVAGERGRGPWLCESSFPARSCGRERICYNLLTFRKKSAEY